ncbi:helix-turn-helix transcriptional regulator [Streptomyces poriferorum]|uniref:helix-turn-helix domain-containing protein n=1 Tax=Streptomyces poriferorum TaxID=2798799 RepID=UPI00273F26D8|nr:helix-turn-helix transcriptional regulator [Streptomyces sp. Alt1]WLQ51681.1 helix-turn-helix transcriptional regulator [Streptomyces sp. Alt1]
MPQPKDLDPYTDPRAFYGAELRRLREAAGLSQGELGSRAFCSGTYIGLFEAGERRPQIELSRSLDELLGSGEHLQRLCRLARTSKVAGYFADAAELQLQASSIAYSGQLVEEPLLVEQFRSAYDLARAAALSPEASLQRIVSAAKEFATP